MEFPENLYKYRTLRGVARYERVENNIYEDTTCEHPGGHCRIRVRQVGSHWEFDGCENDIAKAFEEYHTTSGLLDTQYYADKESCLIARLVYLRGRRADDVGECSERLEAARNDLSKTQLEPIEEQRIEKADFDDTLFALAESGSEVQEAVTRKVFSKDGLVGLYTDGDVYVCNSDSPEYMRGIYEQDDYGEYRRDEYKIFLSKEALDAYRNNNAYHEAEERVESLGNQLEREKKALLDIDKELETLYLKKKGKQHESNS